MPLANGCELSGAANEIVKDLTNSINEETAADFCAATAASAAAIVSQRYPAMAKGDSLRQHRRRHIVHQAL